MQVPARQPSWRPGRDRRPLGDRDSDRDPWGPPPVGAPSQLSLKNTGRQAYVPHRDAEGTGISIESLSQVGWTELEEQPGVTGYQRFWPGLLAGPGPGLGPGPFRTTYFLSEA